MPVITRNQSKNITFENQFYTEIKSLLQRCDFAVGLENRMLVCLEIFEKIDKDLLQICNKSQNKSWNKFACAIFDKINEFNHEYSSGRWLEIDDNLLDMFIEQLCKSKKIVSEIIINCSVEDDMIIRIKNEIIQLDGMRPRRNIPRVNYTGMDTIEPKSEFDKTTNIWADLSIKEDPDYEFEEDEDEDDEEQEQKWAKIYPELSIEEKTEITKHLSQLTEHNRVRRNIARVNYTGMDMSEDDEWLVDGNVKYNWSTTFPWERDEILDEDYVE